MSPRQLMPWVAAFLSAIAAMLLFTIVFAAQIEEPWNITVVSQTLGLMRIVFFVALAVSLVFGLPVFLYLRARDHTGLISCTLCGFLVGATPFAVLSLLTSFLLESASTAGRPTVVNHVPTLAGLTEIAQGAGFTGLFGMAGGVVFWLVMRTSGQISTTSNAQLPPNKFRAVSVGLASTALLLTCATLFLPSVLNDDTCHNLFRDGRTSINPQIAANVKLPPNDWPKLTQIVEDFGVTHGLSLRQDMQIRSGNILWRDVNICNEAGVNIDVLDQPWLSQIGSPLANRGVKLSVYELKEGSGWNPLARDLLARIDVAWPGTTAFSGPDGKLISLQEALEGRQ